VSIAIIETFVSTGTPAIPSQVGSTGRPPTLMKIRGASSLAPSTSTAFGATKRACPQNRVSPGVDAIHFASDAIESATTRSLRALTAFMSTPIGPSMRNAPVAGVPRDVRGARAGDQRLGRDAAVVDAGAAEMLALDQRRPQTGLGEPTASDGPAWPAPITIASYEVVMGSPEARADASPRIIVVPGLLHLTALRTGVAIGEPGAGPESPPCPPRPPLRARPPPGWSAG
jgi:hypothetical protein